MEENNNGKYRSAYSNDGMDDYAKLVRSTSTPPKKKKSGGPKIIIAFIVLAIAGFAIYKFTSKSDGMDNPYKKKDTGFSMESDKDKVIDNGSSDNGNDKKPSESSSTPDSKESSSSDKGSSSSDKESSSSDKESSSSDKESSSTKPSDTKAPKPTEKPVKKDTPTPVPKNTDTPTPKPTNTTAPKNTPTPKPANTATPVPKSTNTPTVAPTKAATQVPTKTPTKEPTKAPTKVPTKAPTKAPATSTPKPDTKVNISYNNYPYSVSTVASWNNGATLNATFKNPARLAVDSWQITLVFDKEVTVTSFWDCDIKQTKGKTIVINNADYNKTVGAGSSVTAGLNISVKDPTVKLVSAY